jgi:hypothetical protein
VAGDSISYSDVTAQPGTTYSYTVDAFDAAGNHSPPSTAASVTTPSSIVGLTATPAADAYVNADVPSANHGGIASLCVDASPDTRSYLRFTVSGL